MSKQHVVKIGTAQQRADHRANVAIKKEIPGRTMFFGRERNKRSRKYRRKLFARNPIDLTAARLEPEGNPQSQASP